MTMTEQILHHVEEGVLSLTFNRLERKNAIAVAMYAALADALEQAGGDPAVRVAVIQGHETVFTAGNDLADFLNHRPGGEESPAFRFLRAIAAFEKPLIAAVCGPAVGIGTTLLFHCDLVYAGDNAAFSMPFVNLGLCPEAASSLLVPRMFGYHRAAEALLLGEPFRAETALEWGLVNRIVPPAECNALAQTQARRLAAKPLASLIATKQLMKGGTQADEVRARMAAEGEQFAQLLPAPAAREAMTAFMEKRTPDFKGL
ncbi:MAG: enoyl-CoA hydratase [Burkholderiaceae bacterium]|jgi:enoyl-CoA hydratase/carnithine racemase|nr:enoyl-CoA hydratase [Burkholderiaceae bacterium]